MLTGPLPTTLDVRKVAAREATVSGTLRPRDLPRFRTMLADDDGLVQARLSFRQDEERRCVVHVEIEADFTVICQRCLAPMSEHLSCDNLLAVVYNDQLAAELPRTLDPLVVEGQSCNIWELVEDELMLAKQPFSYHDQANCNVRIADYTDAVDDEPHSPAIVKENPFHVLGQLKSSGGDDQE